MRLKADQLPSSLKRSGLLPLYYLCGDEPLQLTECADLIRKHARENGMTERVLLMVDRSFDWNLLAEASASMSLFSERKLIELRLGTAKPGREGGQALVDYCASYSSENTLLVSSAKIERKTQQTKWFKALDNTGAVIQVWDIEPARLPDWIRNRCRSLGKDIDTDAAALIADRVEGNLLAAKQEIEKLCLLVESGQITLRDVLQGVVDSARFDVFDLIEQACLGNMEKTRRMLLGMRNEGAEPIAVFGAVMWEFRRINHVYHQMARGEPAETVFSRNRVWPQRQTVFRKILSRIDREQLAVMLSTAAAVDRCIKGAERLDSWDMLEKFLLQLAGARLAA